MKEFATINETQAKQDPYPYIYMEEDGSFRELTDDEKTYLEEKFHPADGGRPYVKFRKAEKTSDGKNSGFIKRTTYNKKWWQIWE